MKKVYIRRFGCQMGAVLYDYYSVFEGDNVLIDQLLLDNFRRDIK